MNRRIPALVIMVAAVLLFTGCDKLWNAGPKPDEVNASWHYVSFPDTWQIIAGQNQDAGDVIVWSTGTTLFVRYEATGDWWLNETHVVVATTLGGIPKNNGGAIPGQFSYKAVHSPYVKTFTYEIPWQPGWEIGDELFLATHASVVEVRQGQVVQQQTGWSGDHRGPGKKWWYYFHFKLQGYKDVYVPEGPVQMRGWHPNGDISYWNIELAGVPDGFDVWNGYWNGWCAEQTVYMNPGVWYDVVLWSTCNPLMPVRVGTPESWDNVNYVLNHRLPGATIWDMEAAIWHLRGNGDHPAGGLAKQMTDDAELYGDGWIPSAGDWIAVVMESATNVQLCFIQVDP